MLAGRVKTASRSAGTSGPAAMRRVWPARTPPGGSAEALPSGWWGDVMTPGQVFAAMRLSMAVAACGDSGSAQRRAPTTRAAMVLSELFEQADKKNARAGGCV